MRIDIDRARLAGFGLTVQDVEQALRAQNVLIPAGRIESVDREFSVVSSTDLQTPQEFADIIVRHANGYPIRLGDMANIYLGPEDERVMRSEEHTSELQSRGHLVCRLLLEQEN